MKRQIVIDPVTRIEGHAKVILNIEENGTLTNAGLVVNELRGFEKILVGMEADRMPVITNRICGVCPSAHHLAASKALDAIAGVEPPPAAKMLRELMYMGHFIHSHALSLFVLNGPDLVFGLGNNTAQRNIIGLAQHAPEVAKKALRLRSLGQKINELTGGRGIHPVNSVAGGFTLKLDDDKRARITGWADESITLIKELAPILKDFLNRRLDAHPELLSEFEIPSWMMGTVKDEKVNFYDGGLRVLDHKGTTALEYEARDYAKHLAEMRVKWSYMKYMYIASGDKKCNYRVGPLARVAVAEQMETPLAEEELTSFRAQWGRLSHNSVIQIHARLIELIYACEKAKALIADSAIMGETRVPAKVKAGRGVGHVEAPRGTLFHDYEVNEDGIVTKANLIVATQQNYMSINKSIKAAAESFVVGKSDDDAMLGAIEFAIRCYDPCLSCATHAVGQMPMVVQIAQNGKVVRTIRRGQ